MEKQVELWEAIEEYLLPILPDGWRLEAQHRLHDGVDVSIYAHCMKCGWNSTCLLYSSPKDTYTAGQWKDWMAEIVRKLSAHGRICGKRRAPQPQPVLGYEGRQNNIYVGHVFQDMVVNAHGNDAFRGEFHDEEEVAF